nr:PD-(D/E)XK nuclease family transposase [Mitsuokella multacida]
MAQLPKNFPEEYLAILRQFRFIDDTFFAACLDGDIPCMNLILRLVLARDDIEVQSVTTQQSVQNLYGRGVRFDVLAVDAAGKLYNCEVQRASEGAIPRRARYNSGMLDSRVLAKGTPVRELPETYVIFITEHDTFGAGLPLYHVNRTIRELQRDFGDGAHIIYVNGDCKDDTPLGRLMQDFFEPEAEHLHYPVLAQRMEYFKSEAKGVAAMCELMERFGAEKEAKGLAAGEHGAQCKMARRLLARGQMTPGEVADLTELPLAEVEQLAAELSQRCP